MTLIRFEPIRELENLNHKIQRIFGESFGTDLSFSFAPKVDISDDEKKIYVEAEIPGVKKNEINLKLEDNILTISGEKKSLLEEKNKNVYRNERTFGSFTRSFTLPEEINPDNVEAIFEDGILKISLEKAQQVHTKERNIEIK